MKTSDGNWGELIKPSEVKDGWFKNKSFERNINGKVVIIDAMKPSLAPSSRAEYLVSRVTLKGGKVLWAFNPLRMIRTLVRFREDESGNSYIILDSFGINDVIPLTNLLVGGEKLTPEESADLKTWVAREMNTLARYTEEEVKIFQARREAEQREIEAVEAVERLEFLRAIKREEEKRLAEARERAAEAKRVNEQKKAEAKKKKSERLFREKAITGRKPVTVRNAFGIFFRGIPVTGEEWKTLGNDAKAILFSSISAGLNGNDLITGNPIRAFRVEKRKGGGCREVDIMINIRLVEETREKVVSVVKTASPNQRSFLWVITAGGIILSLPHYPSLKECRADNVKADLVAIGKKTLDNKVMVFGAAGKEWVMNGSFPVATAEAV